MPFRVPLDAKVSALSAGEKQKLEILKQLYLKRRFLFLDEPTSVLTPGEADEVLGMLRDMVRRGELTVLMITHKFREVMAFADEVTVLRRGRLAGGGRVAELTPDAMAGMMIGAQELTKAPPRSREFGAPRLEIDDLGALDDAGQPALHGVSLAVKAGEIVGIAGVSGNGQRQLVEVLAGQREASGGQVRIGGDALSATREEMRRHKLTCLPEEPLKNACVARMSVAENLAFRDFDREPFAAGGWLLRRGDPRAGRAPDRELRDQDPSPDAPIRDLSGGNVQRAVLARELGGEVDVLIAANPCFGLDFAAVAQIHAQIVAVRNRGAAVLLVSEDLDELIELSDRIVVIFNGRLVYEARASEADPVDIGRHMAGHAEAAAVARMLRSARSTGTKPHSRTRVSSMRAARPVDGLTASRPSARRARRRPRQRTFFTHFLLLRVGPPFAEAGELHHRLMPLDADAQHLVGIALPPILGGEDLHLAMAAIAGRLHHRADGAQVDDAVAHHAAVEQQIGGRHQPVVDVIGEDVACPRARSAAARSGSHQT